MSASKRLSVGSLHLFGVVLCLMAVFAVSASRAESSVTRSDAPKAAATFELGALDAQSISGRFEERVSLGPPMPAKLVSPLDGDSASRRSPKDESVGNNS
ncbi:MAG: hypothetical protein AAFR28_02120 [Pseudomonadota bacterium]